MGRNQYDGQVRAATDGIAAAVSEAAGANRKPPVSKQAVAPTPEPDSDSATPGSSSGWDFYEANKPAKGEPRLDAAPTTSSKPMNLPSAPTSASPTTTPKNDRAGSAMIPNGAFVIQVAALRRQDDALAIASSLQHKHYLAYVQPPKADKFYRVQVGPFKDQKTADTAKKGLESEGFKAFYTKH
jgi:cell division septation protein DedD